MNNIFTKKTAITIAVVGVALGFLMKYARDPKNADSMVTKTVKSVGLLPA